MPTQPMLDAPVPVPEAIVRALRDAGVDTVFGLEGGNTGRIYAALAHYTDTIRTVLVRNEAYATSAAEAYARTSGKLAVAMGQGSWLLGHGVVGTLEALLGGTPLLLLGDLSDNAPYSHHGPYQCATGEYGGWDARLTATGMTKRVFEPHDPVSAVQSVQLAIKHALSGQPGPVAVLFHSQALLGVVGPESRPRLYRSAHYLTTRPASLPDTRDIASALRTATAPVLLAGGGVRRARAEAALRTLAEATGAAVVTTTTGKGTFPEEHANSAGVFGNFGVPLANRTLGEADLVLVLGSKLTPSDTALESPGLLDPARQRIVQVDIEPRNAAWSMPTDDVIVSDVGAAIASMLQNLRAEPVGPSTVSHRVATLAAARVDEAGESFARCGNAPLHPQRVIADLRDALPDDVVICTDAGENRLLMCRYFENHAGGDYLQPSGAGGMGYAIPAALGAKVHASERTVVAVCGDGGLSMSLAALMTSVEENLPIVVVVFNNGALGWVKHSQRANGEVEFKSSLLGFDYAAIGAAIGLESFHVAQPDELIPAVSKAVESGKPALVVVDVSTEQTFVDLRTELMA
jgi:acetolactate synthase I/II/III large subunit